MTTPTSPTELPPGYCDRNAPVNAFLIVSGITFVLATILVPLRTFVRARLVKSFWWDDVCLIASYLILIPTYGLLWQTVTDGLGRHLGCFTMDAALQAGEFQYIAEVLEIVSTIFSRTSVALFVIRLFAVTEVLRKILYAYTVFMILSLAVTAGLIFGMCTPVDALWNPAVAATATCWSMDARNFIDYYNGAVSILSDFLLALLPGYFLFKLQMSRRLKLGLAVLMAVGLLPAICAITRTALASKQTGDDPLYSSAILIVFGSLETSMLIITAAVPALPPLFQKSRQKTTSYQYNYKLPSDSSRNLASGHPMSHGVKSQARATTRSSPTHDAEHYGIGTAISTPPPDNDIFLSSLNSGGQHRTEISAA